MVVPALLSGTILAVVVGCYQASGVTSSWNTILVEQPGSDLVAVAMGSENCCNETYGFLPCSDSLGGSLLLMICYGGVLMFAAQLIGDGGEALLDLGIMSPTIIGGVLLPVLGAVPDAVIIAVSAASGTVSDAERRVSIGVGTLAGSTIMLLTITLAGCLWAGRCDLDSNGDSIDKVLLGEKVGKTKRNPREYENVCAQLRDTGSSFGESVLAVRNFMLGTSLLYVVVQVLASIYGAKNPNTRASCGISAILAGLALIAYLVYNMTTEGGELKQAARQETKILDAIEQYKLTQAMFAPVEKPVFDEATGKANIDTISRLFEAFDTDHNAILSADEIARFTKMVLSIGNKNNNQVPDDVLKDLIYAQVDHDRTSLDQTARESLMETEDAEKLLRSLTDQSQSNEGSPDNPAACTPANEEYEGKFHIDKDIFVTRMADLLEKEHLDVKTSGDMEDEMDKMDGKADEDEDQDLRRRLTSTMTLDEEDEEPEMSLTMALVSIVIGTVLVTVFSDGVVSAIDSFGSASGVPTFIIGFIVCPFASNASELISSIQFAASKQKENATVSFSQIYAACTMNNTLCLGVLLAVVWKRDLHWNYAAECITIVVATWFIGVAAGNTTTIKTWFAILVICVYPCSLGLVEILHAVGLQ